MCVYSYMCTVIILCDFNFRARKEMTAQSARLVARDPRVHLDKRDSLAARDQLDLMVLTAETATLETPERLDVLALLDHQDPLDLLDPKDLMVFQDLTVFLETMEPKEEM